jgi:hypothetical protein
MLLAMSHVPTSAREVVLGSVQERIWRAHQALPTEPFFNVRLHVALRGPLDVSALERAFAEIVRRHDVLRWTFSEREGRAVVKEFPTARAAIEEVDLGHLSDEERTAEAARRARAESHHVFDLTQAPLLRLKLLRSSSRDHVLLATFSHLVSDGWSLKVLAEELGAIYSATVQGRASPLPDLPFQYADFARVDVETQGRAADFWRARLAAPPPPLAVRPSFQRRERYERVGAFVAETVRPAVVHSLRELAHHEEASLFVALTAALKAFFLRQTRRTDVLVAVVSANRDGFDVPSGARAADWHAASRRLVGPFSDVLPLRSDLSGCRTFRDVVRRVRDAAREAFPRRRSGPCEALDGQLSLVLNRFPRRVRHPSLFGLEVTPLTFVPEVPISPLTAFIIEDDDGELELKIRYHVQVYSEELVRELLARYCETLAWVAAHPDDALRAPEAGADLFL